MPTIIKTFLKQYRREGAERDQVWGGLCITRYKARDLSQMLWPRSLCLKQSELLLETGVTTAVFKAGKLDASTGRLFFFSFNFI